MSTEPRDTPIAQHEGLVTTTLPSRLFHQPALTGEHTHAAKRKRPHTTCLGNALWNMLYSSLKSKGRGGFVTYIRFSGGLLSIMLIAFGVAGCQHMRWMICSHRLQLYGVWVVVYYYTALANLFNHTFTRYLWATSHYPPLLAYLPAAGVPHVPTVWYPDRQSVKTDVGL